MEAALVTAVPRRRPRGNIWILDDGRVAFLDFGSWAS